MCSGRVDPEFVLRAFSNGMDGVFVGGCRLSECNYITQGNYDALNMVLLCKRLLEYMGLNSERLRIEFMSAGDGILLVDYLNDFVNQVRDLGPLGESEGIENQALQTRLEEVRRLIPYIKMVEREKLAARLVNQGDYGGHFTLADIEKLFAEVVSYHIDPEKCQACMICSRKCPVEAIDGGKNRIHVIDQDKCIRCGTCLEACPPRFGAVQKISGESVPPPVPEDQRALVRKKAKK